MGNRKARGERKPETLDFLGFTHYCTKTSKGRWFTVGRKIITKRLYQKMEKLKDELKKRMHEKISETGARLKSVLQEIYNNAGVPGNSEALDVMHFRTAEAWLRSLQRQSQKERGFTWDRFAPIVECWLPKVGAVCRKAARPDPCDAGKSASLPRLSDISHGRGDSRIVSP
jgi:RNA-directed DNA polymerase